MIYKKSDKYTLWGSVHSASLGCAARNEPICTCKYHVTGEGKIYSFDDWQKAEDKFCELTGQGKFIPGKTTFEGTSLT